VYQESINTTGLYTWYISSFSYPASLINFTVPNNYSLNTLHSKYQKINHKFVSSIGYEWFILWIFVMISSIVYYIDNSLLLALIRLFKMEIEVKPKNIKLVFVASPLSIQQRLVGSESR
jgi:hypothetical protein